MLKKVLDELDRIQEQFDDELSGITSKENLEQLRIAYLGRKGHVTQQSRQMAGLSADEKPILGQKLNSVKRHIQDRLDYFRQELEEKEAESPAIDLTLPGPVPNIGLAHPLMHVLDEIKDIFKSFGFTVELGAEAETDFYNFEALNIPPEHPSRDLQDTFYLPGDMVMRTHTSPVQIRTMERQKPPVRMIAPGRCYRKDTPDATHSPMFHQVEGLVVDENVSFADLKGILLAFTRRMFGDETRLRFRPSFFPFTEPSAEVDLWWETQKNGVTKGAWLEILGCGMVDPAVFEHVGYDTEKYTGYAFGMGIERIAMLKYGIDDIRHFYDNHLRFIEQFQ